MSGKTLYGEAERFAGELTDTVRGSVGVQCAAFKALSVDPHVSVRQDPDTGIVLRVGGAPLLTLGVTMRFGWDSKREFLAVHTSAVKVHSGSEAAGEPLFRYEYQRGMGSQDLPKAHIHVHASRHEIDDILARAGTSTTRGKLNSKRDAHALRDLHFPVGGDRFRPALEDVLEMLINELGVDAAPGWKDALQAGRRRWREIQTSTVVRDSPRTAADELERLGYVVSPPATGQPKGNPSRMVDL